MANKKMPVLFRRHVSTSVSNILKRPTFNFQEIIQNESKYLQSAQRRELLQPDIESISGIKTVYSALNPLRYQMNEINAARNLLTKQFQTSNDKEGLKVLLKQNKEQSIQLEAKLREMETKLYMLADKLPNLIDESVKDHEEVISLLNPQLQPLQETAESQFDHKDIGVKLGILNFDSAAKVSGTGWYYLVGDGALLEQALIQYSLSQARKAGFKMIIPPSIVRNEITQACGFKPRDQNNEQQVYELTNDNLCLTGTAEIPLAGYHANTTFNESDLPIRYVGVSRSYRAEAGARGKDTRGLYRVHEFTKVELFCFVPDLEQSKKELESLLTFQAGIINSLGLHCRVLNMPPNDLGAPAYKKYDIECWMRGRGKWGELTSSSNCTDYQSRRFNIKYKNQHGSFYAHTLNGTCMAIPRVIVAIIENMYDPKTESILIPEVLRPYMDDKERIYKQ